ncbi:MAG: HAMP domain-containing protein [Gammaproteobacteria bacterium]|nr:HAMP domain-containing protein [Gammaproteobacteria bacterium]
MLWKRTITVRVIEAFGVLVVVAVALLANMYARLGDINGASEALDRIREMTVQTQQLRHSVLDMQSVFAGAALTRERDAKAVYEQALVTTARLAGLEARIDGGATTDIASVEAGLNLMYQAGTRMFAAPARGRDQGDKAAAEYDGVRVSVIRTIDAGLEKLDRQYTEQSAVLSQATDGLVMTLIGTAVAILAGGIFAAYMLVRQIERPVRLVRAAVDRLSQGDLTHRTNFRGGGELGDLAAEVDGLADRLKGIVTAMIDSAANISTGSRQVARGVDDLTRGAEEQVSSLAGAISSVKETESRARQGAENAQGMDRQIRTALATAGGDFGHDMTAAMSAIDESGRRIAGFVRVMEELASRTNLLALKAVVEAARAGKQDGDFAGVATEAHEIAQRNASVAKDARGLIEEHVEKIKFGRQLVDQSGQVLHGIIASVSETAGNIAEVSMATREQSEGIGQVNRAMGHMDEMVRQNAALIGQAAAATRMMEAEAGRLLEGIACFKMHRIHTPVVTNGRKQRFAIMRRFGRDEMIEATAA